MGACIVLGRLYAFFLGAVDVIYVWRYIYIYTPTPNVNISTQLLKKSSSEKRWHKPKRRRSAVYSWYICTQYPFFFSLSLSLRMIESRGLEGEMITIQICCSWATSLSFCQKSGDMRMNPRSRIISNLLIWPSASSSDSSAFFSPTLPPLGLCKSTNKSNQSANPKHQKISSIHVLKFSSPTRPQDRGQTICTWSSEGWNDWINLFCK